MDPYNLLAIFANRVAIFANRVAIFANMDTISLISVAVLSNGFTIFVNRVTILSNRRGCFIEQNLSICGGCESRDGELWRDG